LLDQRKRGSPRSWHERIEPWGLRAGLLAALFSSIIALGADWFPLQGRSFFRNDRSF
jgi:hypothetical protein